MKTKFYLDCRNSAVGTLKIALTNKGETRHIPLDVHIAQSQWDGARVVNHKNKTFLNAYVTQRKLEVDTAVLKVMQLRNFRTLSINEIKRLVLQEVAPDGEDIPRSNFAARMRLFAGTHKGRTQGIYLHTLKRMGDFCPELETLDFEDITKDWIVAFDAFLAKTMKSKNARNVHLRNIRATFNDAIDNGITTAYPFRKISIKPVPTAKRSLSVEQLRTLFAAKAEPHAQKYLDLFRLGFLMMGINLVDLCALRHGSIVDGRIEYVRAKTGRAYSIKIEPEMEEILRRYKGDKFLLAISDTCKDHRNFIKMMNKALKHIGKVTVGKQGKKSYEPMFPNLSYYWCRHTWATIAAGLDIPKEVIAHALGHGGNTVTDIYIDFDMRKVDEANRKVIDYVFGKS